MATDDHLTIHREPEMDHPRLVLGLSGWMNGGEVSLSSVKYLAENLGAERIAEIDPRGFYIYNFPGSMEISALFRPHVAIEDGLVNRYEPPTNVFDAGPAHNLILFQGKEPNVAWEDYAECVFALASRFGVRDIYFVGSYAGAVPHTRDPRLHSSVSEEAMKPELAAHGIRFSDYEGPGSIATLLTRLAPDHGMRMATVVAEIPAYVQGTNPRSIEAVIRGLGAILGVHVDVDNLRAMSDTFEAKVAEALEEKPELAEMIRKMEAEYDNELFETQMGDLKDWLEQRGIRLD